MLTCVCRPVSGNLPKMPSSVIPAQKARSAAGFAVVTAEPKINVPGRLTSAELRAMALRQQQQIDSQHQLLATKEQRLRFLKSQEVRSAVANAEGERERLRRLRERVEAQESKLRRLRALRGQVDLQKTYNVTLSNDLDSIRALFSEKEKELSLAVAKVEALTRQLEDLRRDRRCPMNMLGGGNAASTALPPQASRELEKLRRELMYRNQLSLQQDARLHLQREALQQRQAELRSVDQRIYELQTRLQRKKAANIQVVTQNQHQLNVQPHLQQQQHQQQQQQQHQTQQQSYSAENAFQTNIAKHGGVAALKQQLLQKHVGGGHIPPPQLHAMPANKFSNMINREQNRNIQRGNVAAVEPYIHTPQKSSITPTSSYLSGGGNIMKHAAATANTNLQNQLIQDLTHVKLNLNAHAGQNNTNFFSGESDESKLAKKLLTASLAANSNANSGEPAKPAETDSSTHIYAEVGPKKRDLVKDATANLEANSTHATQTTSKIPKSINSTTTASALISKLNSAATNLTPPLATQVKERLQPEQEKLKNESPASSETLAEKSTQQLTVHSTPLGVANKSLATPATTTATTVSTTHSESGGSLMMKPKPLSAGNLAVPPRKPISSVAPTSLTSSAIPKMVNYSPRVNRVAPNVVSSSSAASAIAAANADRPALPPKPSKMSPTEPATETSTNSTAQSTSSRRSPPEVQSTLGLQTLNINDNLPIKAKPLTIRKQPMSEQPRLKSNTITSKPPLQPARKIDIPTASAFLFPDSNAKEGQAAPQAESNARSSPEAQQPQHSPNSPNSTHSNSQSNSSVDETDKVQEDKSPDSLKRRMRGLNAANSNGNGKPKLARRVSFDPLALLLDASLEGELELVKKTAMQVANPSAANDEGITALHNAICAGHFDIVKFLVEFGCDVNAQDSDGWTPLHCAASCNNLSMVKFLVESGACLFAATLSDHETPAEKCEEDEEGFDGCSEYLYSIQEKLGILHNGEVYAVFSYEAQNSDELTFNVNDSLVILRKGDDAESEWWWAKNTHDEEGYVPRNLLGLYPRVPPQSSNFND